MGKRNCRSHPLSKRLSAIRAHLLARSPPLALLEVTGWDCVAAKQQENALKFVMDDPEVFGRRSVRNIARRRPSMLRRIL